MLVKELIAQLEKLPMDAQVYYVWDGESRTPCEAAYLAKNGRVVLVGEDESIYNSGDSPEDVT